MISEFDDDLHFICSDHKHKGDNYYKCNGHSKGDYLMPTFHGDPTRENKFWVYPSEVKL
jgi:hypothetical protein